MTESSWHPFALKLLDLGYKAKSTSDIDKIIDQYAEQITLMERRAPSQHKALLDTLIDFRSMLQK